MDVRLIRNGEETKCNDFYNRMHRMQRSIDQWRWDFVPGIFESSSLPFVVVEDAGKIVGTQALIPIRMIGEEGVFWTAKSEETILDPAYRGKRLFEQMYRLLFDYAETEKLAYIWGFTQATKPFGRLGFDIPSKASQLFLPFSGKAVPLMTVQQGHSGFADRAKPQMYIIAGAAAASYSAYKLSYRQRRLRRQQSLKSLQIRTLSSPPTDAGEVCQKFIERFGGKTVYRDADYLRWRIFTNPYLKSIFRAVYDGDCLVGWVAFAITDQRIGQLVDLIAVDDPNGAYTAKDVVRLLLVEAALASRNMGALAIRGWSVNNHPFDKIILGAAKSLGFYHVKRGHAMVIYSTVAARKDNDVLDNWFVTRIFTEGTLG